MVKNQSKDLFDIFIIGGGINGCGIARDAVGRGLSVYLAEMNDIGSATSSASTKMFHGGLRYLEYLDTGLVKKALIERETLLSAMPHISWPMRFVLPYNPNMRFENSTPVSKIINSFMPWLKGKRPAWLIRAGLFLYDNLGGRKTLPATSTVDLTTDKTGKALKDNLKFAFEYSDCWVQDARLVALNARDAKERGAKINTHTKVISTIRKTKYWEVKVLNTKTNKTKIIKAKLLINASGPWADKVNSEVLNNSATGNIRLVRGSHIVVKKIHNHNKSYFLQGEDGRIMFAIPYEDDFTLIGTTDADHNKSLNNIKCNNDEIEYMCSFANKYFKKQISKKDVVWTYSGVRPLYFEEGKNATSATRDYVLELDDKKAPLLNIFGGKITTYRYLAEIVMDKINPFFPNIPSPWTAGVPLAGGDFPVDGVNNLINDLCKKYKFLNKTWATRLVKCYGTDVYKIFNNAKSKQDLGIDFGSGLTQAEVDWLIKHEFASQVDDIIWRRTKLGLRMSKSNIAKLNKYL